MHRHTLAVAALTAILLGGMPVASRATPEGTAGTANRKSVLIVYHGGRTPYTPTAPLDQENVDALTQPTTEKLNAEVVAGLIRDRLTASGYRVQLLKATQVRGPKQFLEYDGIIFGTPTWFSNVAYPVKRIFDEHLIRIYEHREGRLNDKVLSGYATVMERGEAGPRCLQCLTWGLEHLSESLVEGAVVNVFDDRVGVDKSIGEFCHRFASRMGD